MSEDNICSVCGDEATIAVEDSERVLVPAHSEICASGSDIYVHT